MRGPGSQNEPAVRLRAEHRLLEGGCAADFGHDVASALFGGRYGDVAKLLKALFETFSRELRHAARGGRQHDFGDARLYGLFHDPVKLFR